MEIFDDPVPWQKSCPILVLMGVQVRYSYMVGSETNASSIIKMIGLNNIKLSYKKANYDITGKNKLLSSKKIFQKESEKCMEIM